MTLTAMFADGAILVLKVSLWCAVPLLLRPVLARLSASTRHLLLTLTLAGTIAMPLLLVAAPAWQAPAWLRLPELAAREAEAPRSPASGHQRAVAPVSGGSRWAEEARPLRRAEPRGGEARGEMGPGGRGPESLAEPHRRADPAGTFAASTGAAIAQPQRPVPSPAVAAGPLGRQRRGAHWLGWIWLAGGLAAMVRTALAARRAIRVVRGATPIDAPRASAALTRACRRARLAREPELRQSRSCPVPFAWRGLKSTVVLPPTWRRWDDERLTVVLVHELSHLRRRDALALWIGRLATALWWFHPLVRRVESWARRDCEQAADDAVLLSGSRASEYAEHLLAISRALPRPLPSGVTPMMSNGPDLKHRLLAILRRDQPRRTLTGRLAACASLLALIAAAVLAGARFAPAAYAQPPAADAEADVDQGGGSERHPTHRGRYYSCSSDCDSDCDSDADTEGYSRAGRSDWKRAYKAHREGRYDDAIPAFEAAAAAGFRPAIATYNAACGLSLSGRGDEALATLERALELGLDDPELLAEDSDLDPLRADGRFQALVDQAFELAGERRDPIDHYRYRSAREALTVLRDTGSEDSGAWSKVGLRLLTLRQLSDAAEALENAARFAREAPATSLYNLACAYALDGRPRQAIEALERSIEAGYSDPDHILRDPDLRSLRGEVEFERLVDLAEALDLDRFRHAWWTSRHRAEHGGWKRGGRHDHGRDSRYSAEVWAPAIDFYQGFVDDHPSLGAGWFNLGYALHSSQRFEESTAAFSRAGQLGFRPATSTYNVACGLSMLNRLEEAMTALEEAVDLGFRAGDLEDDSDLDNLRQDPRFRSLRLKLQLERRS